MMPHRIAHVRDIQFSIWILVLLYRGEHSYGKSRAQLAPTKENIYIHKVNRYNWIALLQTLAQVWFVFQFWYNGLESYFINALRLCLLSNLSLAFVLLIDCTLLLWLILQSLCSVMTHLGGGFCIGLSLLKQNIQRADITTNTGIPIQMINASKITNIVDNSINFLPS